MRTLGGVRRALVFLPLVCAVAVVGCSSSDDDTGSDGGVDSGKKPDSSTPTGQDATTPPADSGPGTDAAKAPDTSTHDASADGGKDATTPVDAGADARADASTTDASTTMDAGSDTGTVADAGSDATTVVVDASVTVDASADASANVDASVVAVPTDAIGAWHFNETTGTVAADSSGHGHAGTVAGGGTWTTGKVGGGLALDGTGYVDLGASLLDTTKSFTVVAWLKLSQTTGWQTAISQEGTTLSVFTVKRRDDNAKIDFDFPGTDDSSPTIFSVAQAAQPAVIDTWYHVVSVFNATAPSPTLSIYTNGALDDSQPSLVALSGAGHTIIGRGRWLGVSDNFWHGAVDEVQLYARPLIAAEVGAIYDSQK